MRRLVAAAIVAMTTAGALAADDPLIRDFDPAVAAALGTHMYRQDQFSWKATDILLAKHPAKELQAAKAHGWIVVEGADKNVVRFIREGASGPEVAYDVTFGQYGTSELSEPADRALAPDDLAQYRARMLALQNFDFRCTSMPPNTVAFKDDHGDWLVWAMTATNDPNVAIVGGHIRFTISADGKTVKAKEKLSVGCGLFGTGERNGNKPVSQFFTDVVSLKPLESHVFANYAYRIPLFIGTSDGVIWKIDQGVITTVDLDAPGADGYTARAAAGSDEICHLILEKTIDGQMKFQIGDTVKVIGATEDSHTFTPSAPSGTKVAEVVCGREDIVPAPNDYKVLLAGYPLSIFDRGRGHPHRTLDLSLVNGRITFEFKEGTIPADIAARLQTRINTMQAVMEKATGK